MNDSEHLAKGAPTVIATLQWHVGDTPLELQVPALPVEPQAILPALQKLVDEVVALSVKELESRNKTVTCKAGCSTCCYQLIPISDVEAYALAEVIERMPEERRAHVMERFADAERRLSVTKPPNDIIEALNSPDRFEFAFAYFKYGVACPFLEDECCSIYPDRPLVCREYLVHTPVERCSRLGESGIGVVPISHASKALLRISTFHDKHTSYTRVPLSLLPYWLARHPKTFKRAGGDAWMMRFVDAMEQVDQEDEAAWQQAKKEG